MVEMRSIVAGLALVVVLGAMPLAASAAAAERLAALLRIDEVLEILREEGIAHGVGIGEALLVPGAGSGWAATVARVHDPDTLRRDMMAGFADGLPGDVAQLDQMEEALGSALGQRVVALELGARRAMLEPDIDEAARLSWAAQAAEGGPRVDALRRFVEVGDLLERNVAGGLNATMAFYLGLAETGAAPGGMNEADLLADVWGQEPAIRAEVEEWLNAYLALAFSPLPVEDLEAYVDFFATPEGQALNAALFAGFNRMFEAVSRSLGRAAGMMAQGEDL